MHKTEILLSYKDMTYKIAMYIFLVVCAVNNNHPCCYALVIFRDLQIYQSLSVFCVYDIITRAWAQTFFL